MEYVLLVIFLLLVIAYLAQTIYSLKKNEKEIIDEAAAMLNENDEQWTKGQEELEEMYQMTILTLQEKLAGVEGEYEAYKAGIKKVADEIERDIALWEGGGPETDIHG